MRRLAALVAALVLSTAGSLGAQEARRAPRIAFVLTGASPAVAPSAFSEGFRQGLRELGYVEGHNITVEYRGADFHAGRMPAIMAELVGLEVDVIATVCGPALEAARQATRTIPIVVIACNIDLVRTGIVQSLAQPGTNVTGVSKLAPQLAGKRLELLKHVVPGASRVAVLWNPGFSDFAEDWHEMRTAAVRLGLTLHSAEFRSVEELDRAFADMTAARAHAFVTFSDATVLLTPHRFVELAAQHRLPAMYPFKEVPAAGGLMSYGPSLPQLAHRAARHVDRILRGAHPASMPIEQPTEFELVVNLRTAKALELAIPPLVRVGADQLIE